MPLQKDFKEFIESLNSNGVEYLIVGAFALAYHGWPRYTKDLDLSCGPSLTMPRGSSRRSTPITMALLHRDLHLRAGKPGGGELEGGRSRP
jgi:hypothetical protein